MPPGLSAECASARRCVNSVRTVGFDDVECYYVEPNIGDPMALVSSDVHAASAHFVRTVRRNRPLYSPVGYLVRWLTRLCELTGSDLLPYPCFAYRPAQPVADFSYESFDIHRLASSSH